MRTKSALLLNPLHLEKQRQEKYYFPEKGKKWQCKSPKEFGIDAEKLRQAIEFAMLNEHQGERDLKVALTKWFYREPFHKIIGPTKKRGNPNGMILKNGYIIAKWGNTKRVDMALSTTKSYLSTIVALALDAGLIESLDHKVNLYIKEDKFTGDHNSKITWEHLLTQSSDWAGELWGGYDWAERPPKIGNIDDWQNRKLHEPGTCFKYNNVRVNLLAYLLLKIWREPLPQILRKKIMDPIGASDTWRWYGYEQSWVDIDGRLIKSVSGGGHWGGGLFISTEDQAKYGLLFLNNGNWNGQQLFSPGWVKRATTPSKANENYGYMWWLNRKTKIQINGKLRHWKGVSENVFYASGFGGNLIVVDNANDLVIVTRWLDPAKTGEMIKKITEALASKKN